MLYNNEEYYENIEELIEDDFHQLGVDIEDIIEDIIHETIKEIYFNIKVAENIINLINGVAHLGYAN